LTAYVGTIDQLKLLLPLQAGKTAGGNSNRNAILQLTFI